MRTSLFLATLVAALSSVVVAPQAFAQSGTNVAVIDISYISQNHTRFKNSMEDIKKDIEAFEGVVRSERQKITTETEKLKSFNPSSPDYRKIEEGVARMQADLQLEMARKRKEFLEREAQVYFNHYKEVVDHVTEFATRHNIGLVLRFNAEDMDPQDRASVLQGVNRAVVYQRQLNITNQILDQINRGTPPANVSGAQIPRRR